MSILNKLEFNSRPLHRMRPFFFFFFPIRVSEPADEERGAKLQNH